MIGAVACFATAGPTQANTVSLAWEASPDSSVVGYNLSYGTASGDYTQSTDVGTSLSGTISGLSPSTTYFAVVTAYNAAGLHSLASNEVSFTTPANSPPVVTLTSPTAGASLNGSTAIVIGADATDSDGTIAKVEFYSGTDLLGQATTAPFTFQWNNAVAGNYVLTALAYDNSGAAVRSSPVSVTVAGASWPGPSPSPTAQTKLHVLALSPMVNAGGKARFKVVASQVNLSQPTTVNYTMGGTAASGVDYMPTGPAGQITIPMGSRSAMVVLQTVRHASPTQNRTATVTLVPTANYTVGQKKAVVVIVGH
ncbi:MAG: hypothetical protein QOG67_3092 [Verrucomicrobiota bacterium]